MTVSAWTLARVLPRPPPGSAREEVLHMACASLHPERHILVMVAYLHAAGLE